MASTEATPAGYDDRGTGAATVLLHPFPLSRTAWAGIADAHIVLAYFGTVPAAESKRHALAAARKALELDASSPAGHTALACATLLFGGGGGTGRRPRRFPSRASETGAEITLSG